jgi:hypothetical protein
MHDGKRAICEETVRKASGRYGANLRAIVLTGSLARDEASFARDSTGWRLLGDADFFLVFHNRTRLPVVSEIESLRREVTVALAGRGLLASVGLGPLHECSFETIKPSISSYELRCCGQVVWGDDGVRSLIPEFSAHQIPLEDGWRMLANRIVELLEAIASEERVQHPISPDTQYRAIKLYLDMATSYLVFVGRYRPTYQERAKALEDSASDRSPSIEAPFPLRPFADRVTSCTRVKLGEATSALTPQEVWCAVHYAHLLWRWELIHLIGGTRYCSDSELMSGWMERQTIQVRFRGLASLLRRCVWRQNWRQVPRWIRLGCQATPRYWVYRVATEIFFRLPSLATNESGETNHNTDWNPTYNQLPLLDEPELDRTVAQWRSTAALASLTYRRFLENTTA